MLVVVTTHPIQYQTPIWRELARRGRVPIKVIFLCDHGCRESYDSEFGRSFTWDIDLLEGYPSEFVLPGRSPDGFWTLGATRELWRRLREEKPRAVWIQGWQVAGYWQAAFAARLLRADLWLRGETNLRSGNPKRRIARRLALKLLFALTTHFLFIGKANRAFYGSLGVSEDRLISAPYCVENARFEAEAQRNRPRENIRRDFGVPDDAFCFLFVGKFIPKKRPLDIIAAAEKLLRAAPDRTIHLMWVGEGELMAQAKEKSEALIAASGSRIGASFLGFLNQSAIARAYAAADCLVLPSEADETWGLVVNEAMASGLPAIISDACGSASDLQLAGYEQLVYPCGDVASLANSMIQVMANPPSAELIAAKIADYDVLRTVEAVEALYLSRFA